MTAPVFVDTNILLYARDASEPVKQPRAVQWLERLWQQQTGRTSVQALNEFYYNAVRKLKPGLTAEDAWDDVKSYSSWMPQALDAELLLRARDLELRYRLNWWDCLIVAAAQAQNCALLLTEDLQDRAVYGGVTVRNPFLLCVSEASEVCAPKPRVVELSHPRRGRPRRAKRAA
jgi:predicted nucleic acid-binding protein